MDNLISRSEAQAKGLKRYFTGKPCPFGHTVERLTTSCHCVSCILVKESTFKRARPDIVRLPRPERKSTPPTRNRPTLCECCGDTSDKKLCLDHDHITGKFRGWICFDCNTGIGKLGDNINGVKRALKYLRRTGSR